MCICVVWPFHTLKLRLLLFFLSQLPCIHSCSVVALAILFSCSFSSRSSLDLLLLLLLFLNVTPQKGFPCPPYLISYSLFSFFIYLLDYCEMLLLDWKLFKNRHLVYLVHYSNLIPKMVPLTWQVLNKY